MKKLVWLLVLALVAGGVYAAAYRSAQPTGTPSGQIRAALLDAVDALQRGQTGTAMRVVSSDYKDSTGNNRDRLYLLARQASQNKGYWSAVVDGLQTKIEDDTASVRMVLTVHRTEGGGMARYTINMRMRREPATAWLVIPTHRWRVLSADNVPTDDSDFGF